MDFVDECIKESVSRLDSLKHNLLDFTFNMSFEVLDLKESSDEAEVSCSTVKFWDNQGETLSNGTLSEFCSSTGF